MKKLLLALYLAIPSFSIASPLLVPGAYEGDDVTVIASAPIGDQQTIQVIEKHSKTNAVLGVNHFSISGKCGTRLSTVTEMGYMTVAKCFPSDRKMITWSIDQEGGDLKALHIRHDKAGLFGGGYKRTYEKSFYGFEKK